MKKLLLNLTPGEPIDLMNKLPFFDDPMEFDSLLEGVLFLGVHDPMNFLLLNAVRIEFFRGQLFDRI
jgi:hypothetical protein